MYTYEITSQANGKVTVSFSNGDTETYTEQVIISEAQFATEETPFIPPVYEIIEHTRPKVIVATFPDDASLTDNINDRLNQLNGVVVEPTPEELEAQAKFQAKQEWLIKRQALDKMVDEMKQGREIGLEPTPADLEFMRELGQWVSDNRKSEYYF